MLSLHLLRVPSPPHLDINSSMKLPIGTGASPLFNYTPAFQTAVPQRAAWKSMHPCEPLPLGCVSLKHRKQEQGTRGGRWGKRRGCGVQEGGVGGRRGSCCSPTGPGSQQNPSGELSCWKMSPGAQTRSQLPWRNPAEPRW